MDIKRLSLGLLASVLLATGAAAQPPGLPAPPAPPPLPGVPASPPNLWSFLLPNAAQKVACKDCFCNSALGKLMSSASGPISLMSGGLITNRCAARAIDKALLADPKGETAEGAAAKIKKDEAEAKARRAAVRFLGTVDCKRWPEAEDTLINSLRFDKNECVRFEAALALQSGCCCTKKVIKALALTVSASKDDGAPEETSERVRAAAADALAHCPAVVEVETIPNGIQKNGEIKKVELRPVVFPNDFYVRVNQVPREQLVANARGVLVAWQNTNAAMSPPLSMPNSQRAGSVSNVFANAFGVGGPTPLVATGTPVTGAPVAAKAPTRQVSLYEVISGRYNRPEPNVSGLGEYVTPASATTPARGANGYVTVETPATPGTPRTYRP